MATAVGAGVGHSMAVSLMTVALVVALPKWQRMGWCRSERRPPPPMRTVEVQPSAVPVGGPAPIQGGESAVVVVVAMVRVAIAGRRAQRIAQAAMLARKTVTILRAAWHARLVPWKTTPFLINP